MLDFLLWLIGCVCFVDLSISSFNISHQIFNCFPLFILIHLLHSSSIDPTIHHLLTTLFVRLCLPKNFSLLLFKTTWDPFSWTWSTLSVFLFPFLLHVLQFQTFCQIFYPFAAAHPTYTNDLKIPTSNSISTPVVNLTLTTQPTWKYNIANLVTALLNHA